MKAEDWKFKKIIPDGEDCQAASNCCKAYIDLPDMGGNPGEREVHSFHSGFMRGLAWAKAKYGIKE